MSQNTQENKADVRREALDVRENGADPTPHASRLTPDRIEPVELAALHYFQGGVAKKREELAAAEAAWEAYVPVLFVRYGLVDGDRIGKDGSIERQGR